MIALYLKDYEITYMEPDNLFEDYQPDGIDFSGKCDAGEIGFYVRDCIIPQNALGKKADITCSIGFSSNKDAISFNKDRFKVEYSDSKDTGIQKFHYEHGGWTQQIVARFNRVVKEKYEFSLGDSYLRIEESFVKYLVYQGMNNGTYNGERIDKNCYITLTHCDIRPVEISWKNTLTDNAKKNLKSHHIDAYLHLLFSTAKSIQLVSCTGNQIAIQHVTAENSAGGYKFTDNQNRIPPFVENEIFHPYLTLQSVYGITELKLSKNSDAKLGIRFKNDSTIHNTLTAKYISSSQLNGPICYGPIHHFSFFDSNKRNRGHSQLSIHGNVSDLNLGAESFRDGDILEISNCILTLKNVDWHYIKTEEC